MTTSVKIAPPNSLLFISVQNGGRPPYPVRGAHVLATESCISIACYPWVDGETTVSLGPSRDVDPGQPPAFDSQLETPDRTIVISTVEGKPVLKENVSEAMTRVRVWLNNASMPDEVIVGYD